MKGRLFGTLPIEATDVAGSVDLLYSFLFWISAFFFVVIVAAMIYYTIQYRASKNLRPTYIEGHNLLEVIWTVIPTILLLGIFVWGWIVYQEMIQAPSNAYNVHVTARQWSWAFTYPDGRITDKLYVPIHQPIKLTMSSEDVLHSFFVPNFRIKQDVVPGMYTYVWFNAKIEGSHHIFCTEYCGSMHSKMLSEVVVLSEENWAKWLRGKEIKLSDASSEIKETKKTSQALDGGMTKTPRLAEAQNKVVPAVSVIPVKRLSLIEKGHELAQGKACFSCHSSDGSQRIGPSFKGLYGKKRIYSQNDTVKEIIADENYIRESIEKPQTKIVKGFETHYMPPFQGLLQEDEVASLIEYIKSLK